MASKTSRSGWERHWKARLLALESVLGPSDGTVLHSAIPFHLDGKADVVCFHKHVDGVVYSTADLIGDDRSRPNLLGQYELLIATKADEAWAPSLISWLAKYTIHEVLQPWDSMEIGLALPKPTDLTTLLFVPYGQIEVGKKAANLLLCLGITADEIAFCRESDCDLLLDRLKSEGHYPFTDLKRASVLVEPRKKSRSRKKK